MKYRGRKCKSNRIASVRGKSGGCYCLLNCISRLCIYLIIVDLKYNDISGILLYSGYSDLYNSVVLREVLICIVAAVELDYMVDNDVYS